MFDLLKLLFFAEDGGADGGGSPDTTPATVDTPTDQSAENDTPDPDGADQLDGKDKADDAQLDLPKYSSQLDPKKRESEEYKKYLYKHKSLNDVADDNVALNKRLEKAIEIPGKDASPEEVKAFFTKLGVPEDESGYELPDNGLDKEIANPIADQMRKEFIKAGMTKTQARTIWNYFSKNMVTGQKMMEGQRDKMAQTFDARLAKRLEEAYPVKAERDGAMKEAVNLVQKHIGRTGLGKLYKESGLLYNTEFILAISKDEKQRSGSAIVEGCTIRNSRNMQEDDMGVLDDLLKGIDDPEDQKIQATNTTPDEKKDQTPTDEPGPNKDFWYSDQFKNYAGLS